MTMAPIHTIKMTANQYFELGEDPPGVRLELIDGEIVVSPSPNPEHGDVIMNLSYPLIGHIKARKLGKLYPDTDVPFERFTVRRPDLCFYFAANLHRVTRKKLLGPPDLCIEVLSPSNVEDDRKNKFALYQKHKVKHYWIIDPEERSAVCFGLSLGKYKRISSARGAETAHFAPFPELAISLSELWIPAL